MLSCKISLDDALNKHQSMTCQLSFAGLIPDFGSMTDEQPLHVKVALYSANLTVSAEILHHHQFTVMHTLNHMSPDPGGGVL